MIYAADSQDASKFPFLNDTFDSHRSFPFNPFLCRKFLVAGEIYKTIFKLYIIVGEFKTYNAKIIANITA